MYEIVTDGSCDLAPGRLARLRVACVPIEYHIGDPNNPEINLIQNPNDPDEFYRLLSVDNLPKTAASNTEDFKKVFIPILKAGRDVLYFGIMRGLSRTLDAAKTAAEELLMQYPDRRIECLDSRCISGGLGHLVILASRFRDSGASLDEMIEYVESTKMKIVHDFSVDYLDYLLAGGRLSQGEYLLGTILGICPIMHVDYTTGGKHDPDRDDLRDRLVPRGKERVKGKAKAMRVMADILYDNIERDENDEPVGFIMIAHGNCHDKVERFIRLLRAPERFGDYPIEIMITRIGGAVGSHVGPTVIHPSYIGKVR